MSPWARGIVRTLVVGSAVLWGGMGWLRFSTVHNETFDLAFYVRMAWGLGRFEFWEPIVGAHVFGLHVSPILFPLGLLGWIPGALPVTLILVQAACLALAAVPLARFAARRFGDPGAIAAATLWWLHPTPGHVGSFEAHPGTMAVLPLAWAIDAADRGDPRGLWWATAGVLACREDLGLTVALVALVGAWRRPDLRRAGAQVAAVAFLWVAVFALVLHPMLGPKVGSMQLHFGRWGDSAFEVVGHLLTHPGDLAAHLTTPRRLFYAVVLLAPFGALPLLRPTWLIVSAPAVAINLFSSFPTTLDLDVHYLIPALPGLMAAAVEGIDRARRELGLALPITVAVVCAAAAQHLAGATPLSRTFDLASFVPDARTGAAHAAIRAVPSGASVQAADELLPHLAERMWVHRLPPPERGVDVVVFDASHRARFAGSEDLIRTEQEPYLRTWLGREDHGLRLFAPPYLLLARGRPSSLDVASPDRPASDGGLRLSDCLALSGAELGRGFLSLELRVIGTCPSDLAVRLGTGYRPRRVDLLFEGRRSPAQLRPGDVLRSRHRVDPGELRRMRAGGLRVGLLRQSGARPGPGDPTAVTVPLDGTGRYRWSPSDGAGARVPSPVPRAP